MNMEKNQRSFVYGSLQNTLFMRIICIYMSVFSLMLQSLYIYFKLEFYKCVLFVRACMIHTWRTKIQPPCM